MRGQVTKEEGQYTSALPITISFAWNNPRFAVLRYICEPMHNLDRAMKFLALSVRKAVSNSKGRTISETRMYLWCNTRRILKTKVGCRADTLSLLMIA